ncbi:MAG: cytidylate kinase-like family protein [Candidatus Dormibacteraeota bacterium]|uniref:Cytidylate kinase-like family protein n=1 Tax=Candidatus Dormiibacter inghamiae TaxID=3127013 RepID=A0A934KFK9_9BACT|nr:cytidylate kinase-like family protein [Candidatus Dormibacteraeota bacterium]MBJ7606085.1 cytidylate kinase-like family protein [Candidatus Dormibacteraeota bacterium]
MPVITISREFGAGGETVGGLVATQLGAELVDRKIFSEVARRLQLSDEEVEEHEEAAGSFLNRMLRALGSASVEFAAPPEAAAWTPPFSEVAPDTRRAVLEISQQVIREAAATGNAVIVGRGAGFVLRDHADLLNVLIIAPFGVRTAHICETSALSVEDARRLVRQVDANRVAYVKQLFGADPLNPAHYHLVLNTGRLSFEAAANAIIAAAKGLTGHSPQ